MICKNIPVGEKKAYLTTYVLDDSPEYDTGRLRPAVLVLPGGGYAFTSDREAEFVALSFAARGYHAFVLRYSVGADAALPRPVLEGFETIALIRSRAQEWHINPAKLAVCGFSAGGHLASCLLTMWDAPEARTLGKKPEELRPDAGILGYPCIVFPARQQDLPLGVPGAVRAKILGRYGTLPGIEESLYERDGMLWLHGTQFMQSIMMGGPTFAEADLARYSTDRLVGPDTPPTFVWTTREDETVPPHDSVAFADAMLSAGRPVELHLFGTGPHGLSLAQNVTAGNPAMENADAARWFPMALHWLERLWKSNGEAPKDGTAGAAERLTV